MIDFLFVLGRTPELASLELRSFFPEIRPVSTHLMVLSVSSEAIATNTFQKLGGSIKLARVVGRTNHLTAETFASYFFSNAKQKIVFGISGYDDAFSPTNVVLQEVKKILESNDMSCRFISPKNGDTLSSVVIKGQQIDEIIVGKENGVYVIGKTCQVQDFEDWNKRDYGRPYADPRAGMLPPKVARMIVNIALRQDDLPQGKLSRTLLDPFCGMGTIVGEALLIGVNVIGSDQSESVIAKAKRNNEWLVSHYKYSRPPARQVDVSLVKFYVADATHISEYVAKESVDAIVTEPFMGSARESGNDQLSMTNNQIKDIKNTIKGLEKLYIGCLRDWYNVLKPDGKVVIALPLYVAGGREFFVKKVIDMCENLGYTVVQGPIEYSRPQAIVKRKFFVFKKK